MRLRPWFDLLIISYLSQVSYPRRSGLVMRSNHSRSIYLIHYRNGPFIIALRWKRFNLPNLVTRYHSLTPIFKWCHCGQVLVDRRTNTNKKMSLEGIAIIHIQNLLTILNSIVNNRGPMWSFYKKENINLDNEENIHTSESRYKTSLPYSSSQSLTSQTLQTL
jgi:hypothetical protein